MPIVFWGKLEEYKRCSRRFFFLFFCFFRSLNRDAKNIQFTSRLVTQRFFSRSGGATVSYLQGLGWLRTLLGPLPPLCNALSSTLAKRTCSLCSYKNDPWMWDLDWSVRHLKRKKIPAKKLRELEVGFSPIFRLEAVGRNFWKSSDDYGNVCSCSDFRFPVFLMKLFQCLDTFCKALTLVGHMKLSSVNAFSKVYRNSQSVHGFDFALHCNKYEFALRLQTAKNRECMALGLTPPLPSPLEKKNNNNKIKELLEVVPQNKNIRCKFRELSRIEKICQKNNRPILVWTLLPPNNSQIPSQGI